MKGANAGESGNGTGKWGLISWREKSCLADSCSLADLRVESVNKRQRGISRQWKDGPKDPEEGELGGFKELKGLRHFSPQAGERVNLKMLT